MMHVPLNATQWDGSSTRLDEPSRAVPPDLLQAKEVKSVTGCCWVEKVTRKWWSRPPDGVHDDAVAHPSPGVSSRNSRGVRLSWCSGARAPSAPVPRKYCFC